MNFKLSSILAAIASSAVLLLLFAGKIELSNGIFLTGAENKEIELAFIQYIARYGKTYASKEEVSRRFNNFARSYNLVQMHNQQEDNSFKLELNQFADMDKSEKPSNIKMKELTHFNNTTPPMLNAGPVPNLVDWRLSGKVSPVRDQLLDCASCWAHTAVSTLESAFSI